MSGELRKDWQVASVEAVSAEWVETVARLSGLELPEWGARLLWQRGVRSPEALKGFLQVGSYEPASPFAFGEEMAWAVERLVLASDRAEKIAIWGDFDADGITSTAVLWDGLGQFFSGDQLSYFIPNRLKESHGLSMSGIERLAADGVTLIVTCDTGSTNPAEVVRAGELGMDVIVSDHHTLPSERPAVVAIVNPRALPKDAPMAHLSGVAVAYKLVEALYERLPEAVSRPLHELTDLVAIGLIADLVELKGDCRYLAQIGIEQLKTQTKAKVPSRPGVAKLLELCKRAGDRPTDISFGIGPRINAVSRIYGDASFCVELLTSRDVERCRELANKAELANARRKALQADVLKQVTQKLENSDLSTLGVIVLSDPQWPVGVLGLVAGQVAQQYGKPTILLTLDSPDAQGQVFARGSARSVNQIDLYELVKSQAHMLSGFGGHPFAAGLSLPAEDLPMFAAGINQQMRQQMGAQRSVPTLKVDLTVTVADLGQDLFRQISLLEPCGMGNPAAKLLIEQCWFENAWHQKLKDRTGGKVGYIKATFQLCDESGEGGAKFPGLWWGHYKEDLPPGLWDVVVELDYNSYSSRYEVRLVDIRAAAGKSAVVGRSQNEWLLDWRIAEPPEPQRTELNKITDAELEPAESTVTELDRDATDLVLSECPAQWEVLQLWRHQAAQTHQPVALAYASPESIDPINKWRLLLGVAKHVSKVGEAVTLERLGERLEMGNRTLSLGLIALETAGFAVNRSAIEVRIRYTPEKAAAKQSQRQVASQPLARFLAAVQEENFRRQYFYRAPVSTLQAAVGTGE
ncbi:MAG: single-stranded-DNA-specific exonuclease RecJ [Leptolyngbya foveolarum]|uniref:Single-stranded-DNA-specific exonuclease RecJ n=1 Tax=Leptolyngbya foveolarum TaxID=47253 RepID=A0A2W4W4K9_9CYAN|nr:MAG: single-stranded-DNA-specific exonuclease RecJ [Leptolyngbya foveolarum]